MITQGYMYILHAYSILAQFFSQMNVKIYIIHIQGKIVCPL